MKFKCDVELINKDISIKGLIHDLSMNGMYVETSGKLDLKTEVDVKIFLGENCSKVLLNLKGVVKELDDSGIIVEFTDNNGLNNILSQVV